MSVVGLAVLWHLAPESQRSDPLRVRLIAWAWDGWALGVAASVLVGVLGGFDGEVMAEVLGFGFVLGFIGGVGREWTGGAGVQMWATEKTANWRARMDARHPRVAIAIAVVIALLFAGFGVWMYDGGERFGGVLGVGVGAAGLALAVRDARRLQRGR